MAYLSASCVVSVICPNFRSKNQSNSVNYVRACRASNEEEKPTSSKPRDGGDSQSKFDRRGMLFGGFGVFALGGDMGMSPSSNNPLTPDFANCNKRVIINGKEMNCCPPLSFTKTIHDFILPDISSPRVRPAVHLITPEQLHKFENAIHLMKGLDKDDPHNFHQQANIHCAYCNNAYKQLGFPEDDFPVHTNALFFPFHRCYLYFFERICAHLINDPTFALPFWNWDSIPGMQMPKIYNNPDSPLYNKLRDAHHKPPKLVNLNYVRKTEDPHFDVECSNLRWMNKQVLVNGKYAGFLGEIISGGHEAQHSGMGSIENSPHNNIHDWVGQPNAPYEDMGVLYASARDPLFYGHHANVDRVWTIWQGLHKGKPRDYTDPSWLDSSFVFYDEHRKLVRIKVRDCLDNEKLGYVYQDLCIPWLYTKQIPRRRRPPTKLPAPEVIGFPKDLDSKITTVVKRPKKSRDKEEKSEEDEILVIEDIEFDKSSRVHFNVLVNVVDDGSDVSPGNSEFAGTFTNISHGHKHRVKTSLRLVITDQIEDLGLQDDETVIVSIDPKVVEDKVTIGGIKIELHSS